MIGSYVSDDFQFFLEPEDIKVLKKTGNISARSFVCSKEDGSGFIKMELKICVKHIPISLIKLNFRKKSCEVIFNKQDFEDWFVTPSDFVLKNGPNWRFVSSNVYIKTEQADDAEIFRWTIENFLLQTS